MSDEMDDGLDDAGVDDADFDDVGPEELAEADALARALERGSGTELPEDALQTAALLRHSVDGSELGAQRSQAVLDEVFATAKPQVAAEGASSAEPSALAKLLRWLVPVGGLATAGAVAVIVVMVSQQDTPAPDVAAALPAPPASLLQAQAAAAAGDGDAAEELGRQMGTYRQDLYAALDARYTR